MGKKSLEQVIRENEEYGFDKAVIEIAYANVGGESERVMEEIFRLQNESQGYTTVPPAPRRNPPRRRTKTRSSARPSSSL
jgi:hypothetical protein